MDRKSMNTLILKNLSVNYNDNLVLNNINLEVKEGELIAYADSTGFSIGHHLHFETRKTDDLGNFVEYLDPLSLISFGNTMTKEEVALWYEILDINDPDGSGHLYWEGKPSYNFAKEFAKNKGTKLVELSK